MPGWKMVCWRFCPPPLAKWTLPPAHPPEQTQIRNIPGGCALRGWPEPCIGQKPEADFETSEGASKGFLLVYYFFFGFLHPAPGWSFHVWAVRSSTWLPLSLGSGFPAGPLFCTHPFIPTGGSCAWCPCPTPFLPAHRELLMIPAQTDLICSQISLPNHHNPSSSQRPEAPLHPTGENSLLERNRRGSNFAETKITSTSHLTNFLSSSRCRHPWGNGHKMVQCEAPRPEGPDSPLLHPVPRE